MSGGLLGALDGSPAERYACSRAGCAAAAASAIRWRNPKIHAAERWKTWLACPEHVEVLREFLAARSFPLTVASVTELGADE